NSFSASRGQVAVQGLMLWYTLNIKDCPLERSLFSRTMLSNRVVNQDLGQDCNSHLSFRVVKMNSDSSFDPYALSDAAIQAPPERIWPALRKIGPGIILAASIVG